MALIPPFFLDCVVSIGVNSSAQTQWLGTGFIVGRFFESIGDQKHYHTFLVTNKHVISNRSEIVVRFNSLDGKQVKDYPISLFDNGAQIWTGHPSPEIDVAAFSINPEVLKQDNSEFGFFKLDEHALDVDSMLNDGISEGDGVFVLGFPMGIVAPQKKHVIVRSGILARIRDTLSKHQADFLIDANIFPGNSGGPVVIKPEITSIVGTKAIEKAALIGIVKSYVPYKDVAISQQTGNPRVIFEENSGLALVETTDSIKSTVDLCYNLQIGKNP